MKKNIVLALSLVVAAGLHAGGGEEKNLLSDQIYLDQIKSIFYEQGASQDLVRKCFEGKENNANWQNDCEELRECAVDPFRAMHEEAVEIRKAMEKYYDNNDEELLWEKLASLMKKSKRLEEEEAIPGTLNYLIRSESFLALSRDLEEFTKKNAEEARNRYDTFIRAIETR